LPPIGAPSFDNGSQPQQAENQARIQKKWEEEEKTNMNLSIEESMTRDIT